MYVASYEVTLESEVQHDRRLWFVQCRSAAGNSITSIKSPSRSYADSVYQKLVRKLIENREFLHE